MVLPIVAQALLAPKAQLKKELKEFANKFISNICLKMQHLCFLKKLDVFNPSGHEQNTNPHKSGN
jgi:hypothetical protein